MAHEPILIVDDNPSNLKLEKIVLSLDGYDIRTAASAEEALEVLSIFMPRLILMDLQLAGSMDGLELTRRLKANPTYQNIIIVAVTAYAMKGDEEKALMAGCNGYITKPINTETLPLVVASYFR